MSQRSCPSFPCQACLSKLKNVSRLANTCAARRHPNRPNTQSPDMQYLRKCLFYQPWLTALRGFLALQFLASSRLLGWLSLWYLWNDAFCETLSLGFFVTWDICHHGFSQVHVYNLQSRGRGWFAIPPLVSFSFVTNVTFVTLQYGGVLLPWRLGSNWHFGAQNLAHFWGGFVIFYLLHLLFWWKNPNFGSNWTPELDLSWFSGSA